MASVKAVISPDVVAALPVKPEKLLNVNLANQSLLRVMLISLIT